LPFGEVGNDGAAGTRIKGRGPRNQKGVTDSNERVWLYPSYSWIDSEGLDFAHVNEWQSLIRRGYESSIDELLQVQKKHEAAFYTDLATTLPQKLTGAVLLKNVCPVSMQKLANVVPARDVLIEGGVIKTIAAGNTLKRPGAQVN
jgi:hypothetical protein